MTTVHFLKHTQRNRVGLRLPPKGLYPLFFDRRLLGENGIVFEVFADESDRLFDCDVLCVLSRHFRRTTVPGVAEKALDSRLEQRLQAMKDRVPRLIWMDEQSSPTKTQFQVLPIVDKYAKNQLLKDRTGYYKSYYYNTIFADFYKNSASLPDEEFIQDRALSEFSEHSHKLCISWNIGVSAHLVLNTPADFLSHLIRGYSHHSYGSTDSNQKHFDLFCRWEQDYGVDAINFQRRKLRNRIDFRNLDATGFERVSRLRYLNEMRNSKMIVSPFGWGELCYRDFEAMVNGALLVKPDMSHIETWPDLYKPHETYVPFNWDLADVNEVIREMLHNKHKREEITTNAQEHYKSIWQREGQEQFVTRCLNIIHEEPVGM